MGEDNFNNINDSSELVSITPSSEGSKGSTNTPSEMDTLSTISKEESMTSLAEASNGDKTKAPLPPMVPFFQLFRFATRLDYFLMIVGTVAGMANGAVMPLFSLVFGQFINIFLPVKFEDPSYNVLTEITKVALWFFYIGIGVLVLSYLETGCWMITGERQIRRVREAYLRAILSQEIGWFDTTKSSELSTRIVSDTEMMSEAIGDKTSQFIHNFSTFIAGLVMGFVNGWQLALVIIAVTPILAICGGIVAKLLGEMTKKGQDAYAKAGAVAEECFSAIRTVVVFSGEDKETQRYTDSLVDARRVGVRKGIINGIGLGAVFLVLFSTYALSYWVGSRFIANGVWNSKNHAPWNGGDVVTVFFSVVMGAMSIGQASPAITAFANGRAGAYKIYQVLNRESKVDPLKKEGQVLEHVKGDIEFRNIRFAYPSRPEVTVFNNFNLTVKAGQKVALVGDSGGGKSTVVGLLERFYDPLEGEILLDGVDIKTLNVKSLRSFMGLVNQEPNLFATTISENISYGKEGATQQDIVEAAKSANAHTFISVLPQGYETLVGEKGVQISGGQKQRIAIARAMIRDPRILILDEATSALDTENERIVQEAIDKVMEGRTVILIAHRLATIRNCDVIAVVREGGIVELGTHDELIALGKNYKLLIDREKATQLVQTKGGSDSDDDDYVYEKDSTQKIELTDRTPSNFSEDETSKLIPSVKPHIKNSREKKEGGELDLETQNIDDETTLYDVSMKRVLGIIRDVLPFFAIGLFGAAIVGSVMPLFSIVFSRILKALSNTVDIEKLKDDADFYALLFFVLAIASMIGNILSISLGNYVSEILTYRLRRSTFRSMIHQDIGYFDDERHAVGVLTTQLARDSTMVHGLYSQRLSLTFQSLVGVLVGLIIAFSSSWKLTLVVLACAPLLVISGSIQMKFIKGFTNSGKSAYEQAGKIATEAVSNIRTVAAFSLEELELRRYSERMEGPMKLGIRKGHVSGFFVGLSQFFLFAAQALSFWYGGYLIQHLEWPASAESISQACAPAFVPPYGTYDRCVYAQNSITGFSTMMQIFFAVVMSAMSVGQTTALAPDAAQARVAVSSIFRSLDRRSLIDVDTTGETPPNQEIVGEVEFRDVHFSYPTRKQVLVFKGLNLKVPAGKTVALVGSSGSGKSTVVGLLERFYDPSKGEIIIDGRHSIKNLDLRWLRCQLGLVSQEPVLFGTTILANITYGNPSATMEQIEMAAKLANAHDFITALPNGYNTQVGDKFTQLSGGQKQRVAIARAILRNPKILLLDEATSALDSQSQRLVQEALENLMKGRTTILIAHRLSTVQSADHIVVIKEGDVVEQGTHQELLALDGEYAKLVRRQL